MKSERDYYEPVARWAQRSLGCFAVGTDKGVRHGRIDVVGLRDAGGRLSGRTEVVAIEVKRGNQPFATTVGQALGYSIYAERCYLAEYRPNGYTEDHVTIANRLGVGLIQLSGENRVRIREVLSAPLREPLDGLRLEVIEKLDFSLCTICGSLFERGTEGSWGANVARQQSVRVRHLEKAVMDEKGIVYWLNEQANRSKGAVDNGDVIYHRRYLCPDCVAALFGHLGHVGP
jgi:hypothetical protein